MAKFIMLGNYSADSLSGIGGQRTEMARSIANRNGGKIDSIYAILGDCDLLIIADLPDAGAAMKVSAALFQETGIKFSTSAALEVAEFDRIMGS